MDPVAVQVLRSRGIEVPERDVQPLELHRQRLLKDGGDVDEALPGDYDIPLVWQAKGHDRAE